MINYRVTNETYNSMRDRGVRRRKTAKKRTAAAMKRVSLLVCALVLLVGVICLINNDSVSASGSSEKQIYYKSVLVEHGDSIWSIAEDNMSEEWSSINEYVQAIKNLNNKADSQINAGAYISIPYYQ